MNTKVKKTIKEFPLEITKRLTESGKILGIEIIDHIIVAQNGFLSFKEKKLIYEKHF